MAQPSGEKSEDSGSEKDKKPTPTGNPDHNPTKEKGEVRLPSKEGAGPKEIL